MSNDGLSMKNPYRLVTSEVNAFIGPGLQQLFKQNADNGLAFYPPAPSTESRIILQGDILLADWDASDRANYRDKGVPVFSSFNGWQLTGDTDEDAIARAERKIHFRGLAMSTVEYDPSNNRPQSTASMTGGLATIPNTWAQPLQDGDCIEVCLPRKDLTDAAPLTTSDGATEKNKVRPLTKRCDWDLKWEMEQLIKNPPMKNSVPILRVVPDIELDDRPTNDWWAAITVLYGIGASMTGWIEDELRSRIRASGVVDAAAVEAALQQLYHDYADRVHRHVIVNKHAIFLELLSVVWVDTLPALPVAGRPPNVVIRMEEVRTAATMESRKRLKEWGGAFGAVSAGKPHLITDANPYGGVAPTSEEMAGRKRSHDNAFGGPHVHMVDALKTLQNLAMALGRPLQAAIKHHMQRFIGVVLKGGLPGSATLVHIGSPGPPLY